MRLVSAVMRSGLAAVMFFVYRPKLAVAVIVGIALLEIAASVRAFWLLLLGLALLFFGARLRFRGL